jgi:hypothetical protein
MNSVSGNHVAVEVSLASCSVRTGDFSALIRSFGAVDVTALHTLAIAFDIACVERLT